MNPVKENRFLSLYRCHFELVIERVWRIRHGVHIRSLSLGLRARACFEEVIQVRAWASGFISRSWLLRNQEG